MGTRSLISINGKLMFGTHWDGYPNSLGKNLLNCDRSIESITDVAKTHGIDFAERNIMKNLDDENYRIVDIRSYGDWPNYQYDIRDLEIYFIKLEGRYPSSKRDLSEFKKLTVEDCKRGNDG